jgi:hypothetical protein
LKERSMSVEFFTKAPRLTGVGLLLLRAACVLVAIAVAGESAAAPAAGRGTGTGSERAAVSPIEIPLPRISRRFRTEARMLIDSPTVVRRLPARRFIADKKTYEYLLDHLPVASRLSDLLGYGYYRVVQEEDGRLHGQDYQGVEGDVWLIYSAPNKRIYIGEGSYDTWYTPKISAKVLLAVEYTVIGAGGGHGGGTDGKAGARAGGAAGAERGASTRVRAGSPEGSRRALPPPIVTRVDIYVQTSRLVGYLMELLGQVTDKKLSQLVSSAQFTSQELSRRPDKVWNKMKESGMFTPEELEDVRRTLVLAQRD